MSDANPQEIAGSGGSLRSCPATPTVLKPLLDGVHAQRRIPSASFGRPDHDVDATSHRCCTTPTTRLRSSAKRGLRGTAMGRTARTARHLEGLLTRSCAESHTAIIRSCGVDDRSRVDACPSYCAGYVFPNRATNNAQSKGKHNAVSLSTLCLSRCGPRSDFRAGQRPCCRGSHLAHQSRICISLVEMPHL